MSDMTDWRPDLTNVPTPELLKLFPEFAPAWNSCISERVRKPIRQALKERYWVWRKVIG